MPASRTKTTKATRVPVGSQEAPTHGKARCTPSRYAYVGALIASLVVFAVVLYLLLEVERARSYPISLPTALCFLAGLGFAYIWPAGSWRWGLWVSSAFWLAFGFVFVCYLVNRKFEVQPAVSAVLAATGACLGAVAGQRLARWTRISLGASNQQQPN